MENNLFENAKFGDKFVTRGGTIAIYHYSKGDNIYLITQHGYLCCRKTGEDIGFREPDDDIVSKYQEPIDENNK